MAVMEVPIELGGPGSGNFGHAGRPGERGGSAPKDGGSDKSSKAVAATMSLKDHLNKDDHADLSDLKEFRDQAKDEEAGKRLDHAAESYDNIAVIHDSLAGGHHEKEDEFRKNKDYDNANKHGVAAGLHEDASVDAENKAAAFRKQLAVDKPAVPSKRGTWSNAPLDKTTHPSVRYDDARVAGARKPAGVSDERWHAIQTQIKNRGGKRDKTFEEHHEFEHYQDADPFRQPMIPPVFKSHVLSLEVPIELGDLAGHPFHGNQWTGGGGKNLAPDDGAGGGAAGAAPGGGRHPAFANVNARQVIRWCGKQGMDAQACKAALDRAGMPTPLPTIRAELPIGARGVGRKGEQAPIYVFSPEQKAVLRGAVLKTAEGLTEAQIARGAEWMNKAPDRALAAQARNVAAAAVPPAIAAGVNAVNRIQARQPTPANVTPTGQEGYATKKALADQAEADVWAIRQRIQGGDRSQAVYRDRALAGAAAANFHRGAAIAANAEGKNDEMIRHMQKAQYHDARVQHYNGKIIRGDLKVDAGTSDVLNRMNAVRNRAGVPGQASMPASAPPAAPVAHQSLPAQPPKDAEEIAKVEKNLSDAPIADLKKVGGQHVSECYRAYDSGGKLVGYYKPSRGEHVGAQFLAHGYPAKQSYKREQAAWEVAKAVGMSDLVPASVQRNHPVHGAGVIIAPVAGQSADEKYGIPNWMGGKDLDPKAFDGVKDQQRAAVFDYVIQNVDRHQGNWMCKPPDDRIGLIDHGYCLANKDNNFAYKANNAFYNNIPHGDRIPSEIKDAWKGKWPQIEAGLKKCGIEAEAIQHAKRRYDKLMAASTFMDMVK